MSKTRLKFQNAPVVAPSVNGTPQATEQPQNAPRSFVEQWLPVERQRLALAFVVGMVVGLVVLGWWLWPVQWVGVNPADLTPEQQALYLEMVSDIYAYSLDPSYALRALQSWPDASVICSMAQQQTDWGARVRLVSIAAIKNGKGCP